MVGEMALLALSIIKTKPFAINPPNEKLILAYGESTTQMGGEFSWPSQLEKILNKANVHKKYKVINRGGVGINSITILNKIKEDLKRLKPFVVITMMGINEESSTKEYKVIKDSHETPGLGMFKTYRLFRWMLYRFDIWMRIKKVSFGNTEINELVEYLWENGEIETTIDFLENVIDDNPCKQESRQIILARKYLELKELNKASHLLTKKMKCKNNADIKALLHANLLISQYSENNTLENIYNNALLRPYQYLKKIKIIKPESLDDQIKYYQRILNSFQPNRDSWWSFQNDFNSDIEESDIEVLLAILYLDKSNFKKSRHFLESALKKVERKRKHGWIDNPAIIQLLINDIDSFTNLTNQKSDYFGNEDMDSFLKLTIEKRRSFKKSDIKQTSFVLTPLITARNMLLRLRDNNSSQSIRIDVLNVLAEIEFILGLKDDCLKTLEDLKLMKVNSSNLVLLPRILSILDRDGDSLKEIKYLMNINGIDKEAILREKLFIFKKLGYENDKIIELENEINKLDMKSLNKLAAINYRKVNRLILKNGAIHVAMQYPMREIEVLKKVVNNTDRTYFIDNESSFNNSISKHGYDYLFIDRFGGDFGHCSPSGNKLIAENVKALIDDIQIKMNQ
jgi:hypothetical protein